jgi:O-antigen/teichoic acid export membrane protein
VALIAIYRAQIIHLIYGARFAGAADVMALLVVGGAISYFSGFFSSLLLIQKKQKKWFVALLVSLIINVTINYFIIPKYGLTEAGVGYIVGYIAQLLITLFLL